MLKKKTFTKTTIFMFISVFVSIIRYKKQKVLNGKIKKEMYPLDGILKKE